MKVTRIKWVNDHDSGQASALHEFDAHEVGVKGSNGFFFLVALVGSLAGHPVQHPDAKSFVSAEDARAFLDQHATGYAFKY